MVESLTPWVVPVHDTRGSETTSPMCTHLFFSVPPVGITPGPGFSHRGRCAFLNFNCKFASLLRASMRDPNF